MKANSAPSPPGKCRLRLLHLPALHPRDGSTDDQGLAKDTRVHGRDVRDIHTGTGAVRLGRDAHFESEAGECMGHAAAVYAESRAAGGELPV